MLLYVLSSRALSGSLGFFHGVTQGSKDECSKKEVEPDSFLRPEPPRLEEHHFDHTLLVKAMIGPS